MKEEEIYRLLVEEYAKKSLGLDASNSDADLDVPDNLTAQQRERDEQTTALYRQFVGAHKAKQDFVKGSKAKIRVYCTTWVSALILTCIALAAYVLIFTKRQGTDIIALVSALVPLLAAVLGTLNIVIKYVFPEEEEKHITNIVQTILQNDLLNKQENMKRRKGDKPDND